MVRSTIRGACRPCNRHRRASSIAQTGVITIQLQPAGARESGNQTAQRSDSGFLAGDAIVVPIQVVLRTARSMRAVVRGVQGAVYREIPDRLPRGVILGALPADTVVIDRIQGSAVSEMAMVIDRLSRGNGRGEWDCGKDSRGDNGTDFHGILLENDGSANLVAFD